MNGPGGSNVIKETFASDDPCSHNARNLGMLLGAIGGAVIGNQISDNRTTGTAIGLGLGAALGGYIGNDMDHRRCELSKIAKANNLDLAMTDIKAAPSTDGQNAAKPETIGMSVIITEKLEQFSIGSAAPTPQGAKAFAAIAEQYRSQAGASAQDKEAAKLRNKNIRILLVGHTDDTGSSQLNADLSEERARAVARIFAEKGFSPDQVFFQGAGETLPIADNRDESGRAKNRRVEIIDLSNEKAFAAFLANRKPNVAFYRPAEAKPPRVAQAAAPASAPVKSPDRKVAGVQLPIAKSTAVAASASTSIHTISPIQTSPTIPGTTNPAGFLNFGGLPANGQFVQVDIGKQAKSSSFSFISSAYAGVEPPVGSCATDRPRVSHGVKSLRTGNEINYTITDYLPGTYGTSWAGSVNGHLVALSNVAVLRDGAAPAIRPTLLVYRDYTPDRNAKSTYKSSPDVNTYQGDKALLYRVFVNDGPITCIDMVIPNNKPSAAPDSNLIYAHNGTLYQASFSPRIAR